MNKIKMVGGLVFVLSVALALFSSFVANYNRVNNTTLLFINEQKSFTQEISKSIFYAYRQGCKHSQLLDNTVQKYLENVKVNETEFTQNHFITTLWNIFYADVQKFRNQQKVTTGYNSVITAKLVNRIYHNNVLLVSEFDKIITLKQTQYHQDMEGYKKIQYALFIVLIGLLIYLFTQVRVIMVLIQKFRKTSNKIIENATIEGLEPITIEQADQITKEASQNYNHLVDQINRSIQYSSQSMEQSTKSLEKVARNIEDFMELLSTMQENESKELFEKEDVVIDSLETLMSLRKKLKYLQRDLDKLIVKKAL